MEEAVQARILAAKQKGEATVRNCGLAYTIIRPGPLVEEPGGYRGLVFDQVSFEKTPGSSICDALQRPCGASGLGRRPGVQGCTYIAQMHGKHYSWILEPFCMPTLGLGCLSM